MSGRRRPGRFDISLPVEKGDPDARAVSDTQGDTNPVSRRGPMATAVVETNDAQRDRVAAEAAIRAENDALAHEHVRLKTEGLITDLIPLELIDTEGLRRDRMAGPDSEADELIASIREIGLSNPIRVVASGQGRYLLVQGFRRLSAYRQLLADTGEARWQRIPAGLLPPGESLDVLYRRMVDENLVRSDLSFAEMAMLAQACARDTAFEATDLDTAVNRLYATARPQKRSYIRAFAELLDLVGVDLRHPQAIPRNLGLALRRRFDAAPDEVAALRASLARHPDRSVEAERAILDACLAGDTRTGDAHGDTDMDPSTPRIGDPARHARTPAPKSVFRFSRPEGSAKCTAANGRMELRLARDFSAIDRKRLERALQLFLSELDDPL